MRSSAPDHNNLLVRTVVSMPTSGSLESVFVGEDAVLRRLAPGS